MGRLKSSAALVVLLAGTAACTHDRGPLTPYNNNSLYSANQPVVQRTDYVLDLSTGGSGIPRVEQDRLANWFESLRLTYGDRVSVDEPGGYADAAVRQDVARIAGDYGLLLSEDAPLTVGSVQPGSVRVIVSRTKATVPGCPIWEDEPLNAPEKTGTNYGCATNSNIAAMIADPNDLVRGQSAEGGTAAADAAKSVAIHKSRTPSGTNLKLKKESAGAN